ncbi:GNAT family N-acetyltransferase [Lentimicrobium sp. L6]|uniref:GNAT family N-acetyltransferase n=1 Tax=Lentimicrobium sp. L6 TaxID=2735916 RepID=UPI001555B436|nr:GNAT family protein [Lentimicrobium sp. L6]NPD85020.1 GNAT family N-acetyltransferase [Lentimicrobium sp. L6]
MELSDGIVTLREFREEDVAIITAIANNAKIASNLRDGFPHPYTKEDAAMFIKNAQKRIPPSIFAIEFEGHYIGNIGLHQGQDVYRKSAEIGYFIGESYWGMGLTTRAVTLITDYGFSILNLIRIDTGIYDHNKASMRVLEKCGYHKEAIFEKAIFKNGKIIDEHRYAIINPNL